MNAVPDIDSTEARLQLAALFLRRTLADVEQMRRNVPRLIEGNALAWRELQADSERIASMAEGLEFEVLAARSRELRQLAEGRFHREPDTQYLLDVTSAIEKIAILLSEMLSRSARR